MATTTVVDDLTMARDRHTLAEMDDVTLVYVMLGLHGEVEGAPNWGRTDRARYMARMAVTEIAARWIPPDVFGEAFKQLGVEDDDDA